MKKKPLKAIDFLNKISNGTYPLIICNEKHECITVQLEEILYLEIVSINPLVFIDDKAYIEKFINGVLIHEEIKNFIWSTQVKFWLKKGLKSGIVITIKEMIK